MEAPRLSNIRTEDFVQFKEKRAIYERKINAKRSESSIEVPLTSYRYSIDESVLDLFVLSSWIEAAFMEEITEEQVKGVVENRSKVSEDQYDLGKIERVIQNTKLQKPSKGSGLENQVWQRCLKYVTGLISIGYEGFVKTKPKIAVHHIIDRMNHVQLSNRINMLMRLRRDELKQDFKKFTQLVAEETKVIDIQESARWYAQSLCHESDQDNNAVGRKRRTTVSKQVYYLESRHKLHLMWLKKTLEIRKSSKS